MDQRLQRIWFRWDYLIGLLKTLAIVGAVHAGLNFARWQKAWEEIGLLGFLEVAV